MEIFKIKRIRLKEFLNAVGKKFNLFVPTEHEFVPFSKAKKNSPILNTKSRTLIFKNILKPLKHIFLPQVEEVFNYERDKTSIKINSPDIETKKTVIFGARECDAYAISYLDTHFSEEYKDDNYLARRKNSIIITLACPEIYSDCFCDIFEVAGKAMDLRFFEVGDYFFVEPRYKAGSNFLRSFSKFFSKAKSSEKEEIKDFFKVKRDEEIGIENLLEKMKNYWDNDLWSELGEICLGCGICTFICPVCHCFDVTDIDREDSGERIRTWDSCQFSDFTLMASGENPRDSKAERLRQRFFHKFKFAVENLNRLGCTGCGRCIEKCPVNINIFEILKKIQS